MAMMCLKEKKKQPTKRALDKPCSGVSYSADKGEFTANEAITWSIQKMEEEILGLYERPFRKAASIVCAEAMEKWLSV